MTSAYDDFTKKNENLSMVVSYMDSYRNTYSFNHIKSGDAPKPMEFFVICFVVNKLMSHGMKVKDMFLNKNTIKIA